MIFFQVNSCHISLFGEILHHLLAELSCPNHVKSSSGLQSASRSNRPHFSVCVFLGHHTDLIAIPFCYVLIPDQISVIIMFKTILVFLDSIFSL